MTELNKQAEDFAAHGLNLNNQRALTQLKRRYFGEIGQLEEADKQLKAMQKIRDANLQSGKNMLYGKKELLLDDFLNGNKPTTYAVDLDDLKKQGIEAAKAISSRQFEDTEVKNITRYLQEVIEKSGYNPEVINRFRENMDEIPELKAAIDGLIKENQIEGNLFDEDYNIAKQAIVDGILEGAIYDEKKTIRNNPGVMTAAEKAADKIRQDANNREQEQWDIQRDLLYTKDENDKWIIKSENIPEGYELDPATGKLKAKVQAKDDKELADEAKRNEKTTINKENAFLDEKLKGSVLANKNGFTVKYKDGWGRDQEDQYKYVMGVASQYKKKDGNKVEGWQFGTIGSDLDNRGWAFTTSSNIVNNWGNFSATGADDDAQKQMRILPPEEHAKVWNEIMNSFSKEEGEAFEEMLKNEGVDINTTDIRLIEVPNESKAGDAGRVGYLIAINKK